MEGAGIGYPPVVTFTNKCVVSFRYKWPDNLYSVLRLPLVLQARLVLKSESGLQD